LYRGKPKMKSNLKNAKKWLIHLNGLDDDELEKTYLEVKRNKKLHGTISYLAKNGDLE